MKFYIWLSIGMIQSFLSSCQTYKPHYTPFQGKTACIFSKDVNTEDKISMLYFGDYVFKKRFSKSFLKEGFSSSAKVFLTQVKLQESRSHLIHIGKTKIDPCYFTSLSLYQSRISTKDFKRNLLEKLSNNMLEELPLDSSRISNSNSVLVMEYTFKELSGRKVHFIEFISRVSNNTIARLTLWTVEPNLVAFRKEAQDIFLSLQPYSAQLK